MFRYFDRFRSLTSRVDGVRGTGTPTDKRLGIVTVSATVECMFNTNFVLVLVEVKQGGLSFYGTKK